MTREGAAAPLAIVGMACRFAGGATNPEKLWEMMVEKRSGWSEIPSTRFKQAGLYHPNGERSGTMHVKGAHFLQEDVALFDAGFFGMASEFASALDPQYRMELELVYEALENAGIPMDQLRGTNTSVYSGIMFRDYHDTQVRDPSTLPRYFLLGNAATCSSTLTALHLACQSLRKGESGISIVTGSSLMLNADVFIGMSNIGFLSPNGISYAFDDRANGYGRGEGAAVLVLKTLQNALRDGDHIRAVIRETALNQNGRTQTITSPSQTAQEDLARTCYRRVGLNPAHTAYVEAHGTGTLVGDPLEVAALSAAFDSEQRPPSAGPLFLGSVKSNIGHTEGASGLASIIKVVLALEKGQIPPNTRFDRTNEKLQLETRNLHVPTALHPWPSLGGIRRASVNNFGFGGSNAHAILEAHGVADLALAPSKKVNGYEHGDGDNPSPDIITPRVFRLSAKDARACQRMALDLRQYLLTARPDEDESAFWDSLAHTLGARRSIFPYTITVSARTALDLASALDKPPAPSRAATGPVRLGWVFTGQGAQWHAMGRELIAGYPTFRSAILECDRHMQDMGCKWSLMEELHRDETSSQVNNLVYSIALTTSVQIALVQLLWSWGIHPTAVTGHSSGEVAAAYAAGALDVRSAIGIAYLRGALVEDFSDKIVGKGGMVAVGVGRTAAQEYIARVTTGVVVVACVNSQESVTVSGDLSGIEELEAMLKADGVFARRLRVNGAFHSHHMLHTADLFDRSLRSLLSPQMEFGSVIFSSPKSGRRMHEALTLADPAHWVGNMVQAVEFESSFRHMCFGEPTPERASATQDVDLVIEVGPHGALGGPIQQLMSLPEFDGSGISYLTCLVRHQDSVTTMQKLATELIQRGYPVDLNAVNFPQGLPPRLSVLHDLPSYPWSHETRYWIEPRNNKLYHQGQGPVHELLGSPQDGAHPVEQTWRHMIRVSDLPWVHDHRVQSCIVYPGAGLVCMALEAMSQVAQSRQQTVACYELRDVEIDKALIVPETTEGIEVQLSITPCDDKLLGCKDWLQFRICSVSGENVWTQHCTGQITAHVTMPASSSTVPRSPSMAYPGRIQPSAIWAALRAVGIHHGPAFQNLHRVHTAARKSVSVFSVADTTTGLPKGHQATHMLHPTTLDSIIQAAFTVMPDGGTRLQSAFVPRRIRTLRVRPTIPSSAGHKFDAYAVRDRLDSHALEVSVTVVDSSSSASSPGAAAPAPPMVELEGLLIQSVGGSSATDRAPEPHKNDVCSRWEWAPDISLLDPEQLRGRLRFPVEPAEVDMVMDLRRATVHHIRDTLDSLTPADIDALQDHHRKLHRWMVRQLDLARQNALGADSAGWLDMEPDKKRALFERVAAASVNGEMLCRLGGLAASILRQEVAPLEVMLEGRLLFRYYKDALKWDRSTRQVGELIKLCTHKNPRARILEIGAGTGGGTQIILDALGRGRDASGGVEARLERYDFTDVSSGFFEAAKERFAGWSQVMSFQKLDIEEDPTDQGFEGGAYDVVIACQVLHATKRMVDTLRNVRKLLKPGGKLILVETTRDELDVFFSFGLLPGWWLSEEEERKTTPSLTVPFWGKVLSESGFAGIDLEVHDCESEEYYSFSTIMATAMEETQKNTATSLSIVTGPSQPPADWLGELQVAMANIVDGPPPAIESLEAVDPLGKVCVFLGEADQPLLDSVSSADFQAVVKLVSRCRGVLWVTRGGVKESSMPTMSLATGILRTLRSEYPNTILISLDLNSAQPPWTSLAVDTIVRVLRTSLNDREANYQTGEDGLGHYAARDFEYAERDGILYVPRAVKDVELNQSLASHRSTTTSDRQPFLQLDRPLRMVIGTPGLLDTLVFTDDPDASIELPPDYIEMEPRAFGLNFRDIMVAMGQLEDHGVMGFECAGRITRLGPLAAAQGFAVGDRVCSLLRGHWSTRPRAHWTSVARIPQALTDEEAASVPTVFATAYIALYETARLQAGDTVLIHAASGGVGQAAIVLAQRIGAEVFVTAGSPAKREFLATQYGIPEDHIFSSRDVSFVADLRAKTGGDGVDVVLNSLAGRLLQESFNCVREFGRFVEIGKRDLEQHSGLDMYPFTRNVSFMSVDLRSWGNRRGTRVSSILQELMQLFEQKQIRPVSPITVFPISKLENAFRTMQAGQHMGKIVVSVSKQDSVLCLGRPTPLRLRPDASYLIAGGMGGIGRSLCQWMAAHGARQLIVVSRSARQEDVAAGLDEQGCRVRAVACDIADEARLREALLKCADLSPVRGVIHGGMVLKDMAFERMTVDDFQAPLRPKVHGSLNLHNLFQDVDFFIMLSSLGGVVGTAGQANYAAGNVFQDALANFRRAQGLHAVAIDLGMVEAVGHVAQNTQGIAERLERAGLASLTEMDMLRIVEWAIQQPSAPAQITTCIGTGQGAGWEKSPWGQEARFADLRYRKAIQSQAEAPTKDEGRLRDQLTSGSVEVGAAEVICRGLVKKIAGMFGLVEEDVSPAKSLADYGVDSLVAVEMRNWIISQVGADISIFELMQSPSLAELSTKLAAVWKK